MKILILGSKGNLGTQLVKTLEADKDNQIVAWSREDVDITDRELILKKVGDIKPDVIINAVAYNAVDKCEESEAEYDKAKIINIDGPKYLAEAALENKAVLVHYSTDYVFGGKTIDDIDNFPGFDEKAETAIINRYGKSKLHGEKRILEQSGRGLKWYIIRTSKLFGPKGESEFSKPAFFDIMLNLAKGKKELDIVDDEVSCFTYTPDLAKATKELLDQDYGYGIYHFINEGAATWYQGAKTLFELAKIDIKLNPVSADKFPRPAKRPKYSVLLNTKFPKFRTYQSALKEYLK